MKHLSILIGISFILSGCGGDPSTAPIVAAEVGPCYNFSLLQSVQTFAPEVILKDDCSFVAPSCGAEGTLSVKDDKVTIETKYTGRQTVKGCMPEGESTCGFKLFGSDSYGLTACSWWP